MTSKGHALSREALIRTLTAYSGIATADGAVDGTTVVDTNLIGRNDFISGKTILIMSGDAKDEDKGALSFASGTGAITLRGTGVSAQIKAGTVFRVLNISSIEIDVANIQAAVGEMTDPAATGSPTNIEPLMAYVKQLINEILGPSGTWSNLNNEAINSLDLAIQYIAAVMGFNGANIFNPVVGGVPRTNMDAVFGALDVVLQVIDANVDWVKEAAGNDNWGFGALRNHILTNKGLIETADIGIGLIWAAIGDDSFGLGALRNHILTNKGLIETVDTVTDLIWAALGHATWGLGALKALIDNLDADLVAHEASQSTHRTVLVDIHDTDLPAVKTVVDGIQTDLDNATDGLGALKTEIDANETKIDDLDGDLVTHDTDIKNLLSAIAAYIDTEVAAIQTDLDNATDGLGALKALIDNLDADLVAHEASQATHRAVLVDIHDTDLPAVRTEVGNIEGKLDVQKGATGVFYEQVDAALSFNTVNGAETNVLNLVAASTRYIVRSLRLKFADPGAETITVRLYELVNDGLIEVDSFEVTTANFGTYHSLMDMFGLPQLAGDNLKVTTRVSAGGDIATLGQYSHAKTNV